MLEHFLIDRENTGFDPDLAAVQEGLIFFLFLGWLIPEGGFDFEGAGTLCETLGCLN